MTAAAPAIDLRRVPFAFRVGERTLATVSRQLVQRAYSLEELLQGAGAQLPELPRQADGAVLRSMPVSALGTVRSAATGALLWVRQSYPRYYADLSGSFEEYLGRFSGKTRSTLRRKIKKFEELGGGTLDVRQYRSAAEMAEFHALARQVSTKTYQERLLDAGLPESADYLAKMARRAAEGRARGYLLFLNGEPVSYLYTPIEGRTAVYAYLGYDPALAQHSPGTVLQLDAFEKLFPDPDVGWFDFTEGEGQHKRQFATGHIDCADVVLLRPTTGNRALVAAQSGFDRTVERAAGLAERYGLRSRLKRMLRGT